MEVIIKEFNGDVEKSFRRGKKLDPFSEKSTAMTGLYRILNNPDETLTLIGDSLVNLSVEGDKIVVVKGYNPKGIVPVRVPISERLKNIPKATLDVKHYFSQNEIGLFYVVPAVVDKKVKLATVEELAKNVGRKVKVSKVVGTELGARLEFSVSGVNFVAHVNSKGRDYTAKDIAKKFARDVIDLLENKLKDNKADYVYRVLAGESVKISGVEVSNIVYLANNFRLSKELSKIRKKLLKTKFSNGELRVSISKFIGDYEKENEKTLDKDRLIVKISAMNGKLSCCEDVIVGYAVFSKGKRVVFTGDAEVVNETPVKGGKIIIVRAPLGHEFKDTKIVSAMPLTFKELKEVEDGVGGYTLAFLRFILSQTRRSS